MTLVGFPDFQEQAQWQSPLAVGKVVTVNNGATYTFPDSGPIYWNVSNWQATQLRLNANARLDVDCTWYDAIPATAFLAESKFTTPANGSGVVSLPNAGPYLQVNVTNNSGGSSSLTAVVAFTNRTQQPFILSTSGPIIDDESHFITGATTRVIDTGYLYAGDAWFWCWSDSNEAWAVDFYGVISNGTLALFHHVDSFDNPGGRTQAGRFVLPAQPVQVAIHNYGVNGHTFYCVVTPNMFR